MEFLYGLESLLKYVGNSLVLERMGGGDNGGDSIDCSNWSCKYLYFGTDKWKLEVIQRRYWYPICGYGTRLGWCTSTEGCIPRDYIRRFCPHDRCALRLYEHPLTGRKVNESK